VPQVAIWLHLGRGLTALAPPWIRWPLLSMNIAILGGILVWREDYLTLLAGPLGNEAGLLPVCPLLSVAIGAFQTIFASWRRLPIWLGIFGLVVAVLSALSFGLFLLLVIMSGLDFTPHGC
jgi:hypothetical protein